MRKNKKQIEDIKGILNKVIGGIETKTRGKKQKILNVWQGIVGKDASSHSRPASIRRNILTIEVDSSTWFYSLNLKKKSILKDINRELGEDKIEDIRFRMGDIT